MLIPLSHKYAFKHACESKRLQDLEKLFAKPFISSAALTFVKKSGILTLQQTCNDIKNLVHGTLRTNNVFRSPLKHYDTLLQLLHIITVRQTVINIKPLNSVHVCDVCT